MAQEQARYEARRIALRGGIVGFAIGVFTNIPSLVSSGFAGTAVSLAIWLTVAFTLLGAWFPVVFALSVLEERQALVEPSTAEGRSAPAPSEPHEHPTAA